MKKIILWFFAVLGGIFFLIIVGVMYLVVADPFNLRPLISLIWNSPPTQSALGQTITPSVTPLTTTATKETTSTSHTDVTSEQSAAMKSVGIDTTSVENITPEQERCFIEILGQARVTEIKAGAIPSANEFFAARGCI